MTKERVERFFGDSSNFVDPWSTRKKKNHQTNLTPKTETKTVPTAFLLIPCPGRIRSNGQNGSCFEITNVWFVLRASRLLRAVVKVLLRHSLVSGVHLQMRVRFDGSYPYWSLLTSLNPQLASSIEPERNIVDCLLEFAKLCQTVNTTYYFLIATQPYQRGTVMWRSPKRMVEP